MKNAISATSQNNTVEQLAAAVQVGANANCDDGTLDLTEHAADVWAAVLIEVYEKTKDKATTTASEDAARMIMESCDLPLANCCKES